VIRRDIITIGASAGGIEVLQQLVESLPQDFPAAILIAVHLSPYFPSKLPTLLNRAGRLEALFPSAIEPIRPGRIYVAPPNQHLIVEDGAARLWQGPKENRFRPAINPLFRSAAVAHRERVAGVILSGALDDGSAGLWWIKRFGGVTVVQDPSRAAHPEMIQSALQYVDIDYVIDIPKMGKLLTDLATGTAGPKVSALPINIDDVGPIWKPEER